MMLGMSEWFKATSWFWDNDRTLIFNYECSRFGAFAERVVFPKAHFPSTLDRSILELCSILHAVLGLSYYKCNAAEQVILPTLAWYPEAEALVNSLYSEGMAEFFVRNSLTYPPKQEFVYASVKQELIPEYAREVQQANAAVLGWGGGKESQVAYDLLRATNQSTEPVSIVLSERGERVLESTLDSKIKFIRRQLDPRLHEVNESGSLNGRVPVTAFNSLILAIFARVRGAKWVVLGNESSADEAGRLYAGAEVNHRFSKSYRCERLLKEVIHKCTSRGLAYFSILRPFSELWVSRRLCQLPNALHRFRSCNRNFVIDATDLGSSRWCGVCPKCVFSALVTAPFLSRAAIMEIFEGDPLGNPANVYHVREMAGLTDGKPWDCVGTVDETLAIIWKLHGSSEWRTAVCIQSVWPTIEQMYSSSLLQEKWLVALHNRRSSFLPRELVWLYEEE